MKHIKLFEDWNLYDDEDKFSDTKYELKPGIVFKTHGEMLIQDVEQLITSELFFQEKGYSRRNWFSFDEEDYPLVFVWSTDKKYILHTESFLRASGSFTEDVTFSDWFQLKHEFRGHKMKKFGV